jgi:lysosomal acid lipase/cholesteryl ester hydrolase
MGYRGTYGSRSHQIYDADTEQEYWDFTFEEIGQYDIPAVIDFILEKKHNSQGKLFMFSYSLGTTSSMYGMWKLKEFYEQRVKMLVLLAPTIEFKFIKEPVLANAA